ncbi:hypothetical protein [Companilactobacillus mishanensis]|uniref:IpaB/EvcA family protein n=1 Tax=Companilactobacillus mishanensis TaxID=2486008 RepID=A0A5P0ZGZ9_9LACO|nr:hypothetical protein [Companilactobacillus mishanensis]MQS52340.1 hypothetical protein [Companilactobacillus mishanensis]
MEKINRNDLSDNIVNQIDTIEQKSNKKVEVYSEFEDHDTLTLDQATHVTGDDVIKVQITNEKYADFVLLHELYHIELEISDEPSINVSVTSGQTDVDGRILSTANAIFEALEHAKIVEKQVADGSLTDEVHEAYIQGINVALEPNADIDPANMTFYRSLVLLDAIIFGQVKDDTEWRTNYNKAFRFVDKAMEIIKENDLTVPFKFRRALVNVLDAYNEMITAAGYESMNYHEFLAVTPVVSERQLRLSLNQTYQIKHSVFKMNETKEDAFSLLAINDGQSVASLGFDVDKVNPEFYKKFYQQTVKETFEANNIDYVIR